MFTPFVLLFAAGVGLRLTCAWYLRRRFNLILAAPQAFVVVLLVLAGLPSWLQPVPFPVPLSLTLGVVLPDLLLSRGSS